MSSASLSAMYALYQVSVRQATISLSFLLAHTSRCKPWESLWGSLATTPLGDFHHRLTACPSYQKNPGSLTAPGQSYAWTLCYYIFAVLSLDSATLHLGRGIRPIGLSPNILTRASSHRIFVLCLHCSLLSEYYSITEATRPDPTVRPPSRYQTGVLRCANGDFSCDLWWKIRIFCFVHVVLGDFVIMVLSRHLHHLLQSF